MSEFNFVQSNVFILFKQLTKMANIPNPEFKPKSFWQRPEGLTGSLFLGGILLGGGYLLYKALPYLVNIASNMLYLGILAVALAALIYMVVDPRMRNLVWYGYKSIMRWITGIFVNIDPIGILKSYIDNLQDSLGKMDKQMGGLKGQIQKLKTILNENTSKIEDELKLAQAANKQGNEKQMILSTRQAARLQDSNEKYKNLLGKMDILYKILLKMRENSEVLLEDTKDQVIVKEQERAMMKAGHSAMSSAMNVIGGDKDKKAMFDMAVEAIADDVANKVGEMERFMEMSSGFMDSVDLQNGVFEEEGMKMLEKWESQSQLLLMPSKSSNSLDLNSSNPEVIKEERTEGESDSYKKLFD